MIEFDTRVKFVLEVVAIDALAPTPGARGIPTLNHEVFDDSVEDCIAVVALHAELHKVSHSLQEQGRMLVSC